MYLLWSPKFRVLFGICACACVSSQPAMMAVDDFDLFDLFASLYHHRLPARYSDWLASMRQQKRPAANGFGCRENGPFDLRPSSCTRRPRRRPRGVSYLVAAMLADGAAAAAAASAPSNPSPVISSSMTEQEKYEISKQLAKVDPFSVEGSNSGNNGDMYSGGGGGSGITLPESMGESALIDRETGQIFWQGGPGVLYIGTSSTLSSLGVRHVRATALTLILVTAGLSALASKLRDMLKTIDVVGPWWQVASVLAKCTILLPRFDAWFVIFIAALYLLEAHCCSTRRYLANALSGSAAVEDYVEGLRQAPPVARWTVRCFHYEQRKSLAWLTFILRMAFGNTNRRSFESESAYVGLGEDASGLDLQSTLQGPSFLTKKVVTHQATKTYQCASWKDETTVGLWKRAFAPDLTAPFTKLALCKVLLLSNGKARSDYFAQQTEFVTREGSKDQFAEFSTNIGVEGFKSRVLAIRPMRRGGTLSSRFFRLHLFWIFTCLGLTVPYRIWFSRHCDELRVAVIKETFAIGKKPKLQSSSSWTKWFARSKEMDQNAFADESSQNGVVASLRSDFRKRMEELAIYQADEAEETRETAALLQQELEKEVEETPTAELIEDIDNGIGGTKPEISSEEPPQESDESDGPKSGDQESEERNAEEIPDEDESSDTESNDILEKDDDEGIDSKEVAAEGSIQ